MGKICQVMKIHHSSLCALYYVMLDFFNQIPYFHKNRFYLNMCTLYKTIVMSNTDNFENLAKTVLRWLIYWVLSVKISFTKVGLVGETECRLYLESEKSVEHICVYYPAGEQTRFYLFSKMCLLPEHLDKISSNKVITFMKRLSLYNFWV